VADLITIANRKLALAVEERARSIPSEIKAMKAELAPQGLARSGAALKRARSACIAHVQAHAEAIATEYKWVVGQALFASQSWTEKLAQGARAQLEPLKSAAATHLTKLAAFTGRPELAERLIDEVEAEIQVADERIKLAVQAAFAEKSRGLVRSLPAAIGGLLGKVFRSGP